MKHKAIQNKHLLLLFNFRTTLSLGEGFGELLCFTFLWTTQEQIERIHSLSLNVLLFKGTQLSSHRNSLLISFELMPCLIKVRCFPKRCFAGLVLLTPPFVLAVARSSHLHVPGHPRYKRSCLWFFPPSSFSMFYHIVMCYSFDSINTFVISIWFSILNKTAWVDSHLSFGLFGQFLKWSPGVETRLLDSTPSELLKGLIQNKNLTWQFYPTIFSG